MKRSQLIPGMILCLESAERFQTDAVSLYRQGRYGGACVLSTIALELVGQCRFLWKEFDSVSENDVIDEEKLSRRLRKQTHEAKIGEGMFHSITWSSSKPGEGQDLDEDARAAFEMVKLVRKRAPKKFHKLRTKAQYLPDEILKWQQAESVQKHEVEDLLTNVGNNIGTYLSLVIPQHMEALAVALKKAGKAHLIDGPRDVWPRN